MRPLLPLLVLCLAACPTSKPESRDTQAPVDTAAPPDETAPLVTLLTPTEGQVLAGIADFQAQAQDAVGVEQVVFAVDGVPVQEVDAPPWSTPWDTTGALNGNWVVSATALDGAGNAGEAAVSVFVENPDGLPLQDLALLQPADGATLCGPVDVEAAVRGGRATVVFSLDGSEVASVTSEPFRWTWDTALAADGAHTLRATATDENGHGAQVTATVQVANGTGCDARPTVHLTSPPSLSWQMGLVPIRAEASDDLGIGSVAFTLDDEALAELAAPPYETTLDVEAREEGACTLQATATDTAGQATSTRLTFYVDRTDPTVAFAAPTGDEELAGMVTVEVDATDAVGVAGVDLLLDGVSLGTDTEAPFTWTWDTVASPWGAHRLQAVATDLAGRGAWTSLDVTVDNPPVVAFLDPAEGSVAQGLTEVAFSASDDEAVTCAALYLDGVPLAAEDPTRYLWDTCATGRGPHTLRAEATDPQGHLGWAERGVEVDQPAGLEMEAPESPVLPSLSARAWVFDDDEPFEVVFAVDGIPVSLGDPGPDPVSSDLFPCPGSEWTATLDVVGLDAGDHVLLVTATNTAGESLSASAAFTVVKDADADGVAAPEWGGTDCDDADPGRFPGLAEICDGQDQDCDGRVDEGLDADGDGHLPAATCPPDLGTDCDDTDRRVYPGATETCNDVDDDCDGLTDDSPSDGRTWYRDADGDGYGVASETTITCDADPGWSRSDDDCDDLDATAFPFAPELCDGADNDCDGSTDEGLDADGDGHLPSASCPPELGDDCDDGDRRVYPGATETCNDVDDDCDGTVDDSPSDGVLFYPDADADTWGDPGTSTVACDAPAGWVQTGTDCDDEDASIHPLAEEVCDGVDQDCTGSADEPWDMDGDGVPSLATCPDLGTDCDDDDPTVWPGAPEMCDGVDNDCEGHVDSSGVEVPRTAAFGAMDHTSDTAISTDGNVYTLDTGMVLTGFDVFINPSGTETGTFAVYEGDTAAGPFTLLASTTVSLSGGSAWYSSGTMSVTLRAGHSYFIGLGSSGSTTLYYEDSPDLTPSWGMVPEGYTYDPTYDDPATLTRAADAARLYFQNLGLVAPAAVDMDGDGDGVTPFCGDCDDTNATSDPGVEEVCGDGVDNDCDGTADVGPDADGDGFDTCQDCDDGDPTLNPAAPEDCDGLDNDCDGVVDNDADGGSPLHADADGDGFGDPAVTEVLCGEQPGWVWDGSDCDDASAAVWPGNAEVCDTRDNDCDGVVDNGMDGDGDGWPQDLSCGADVAQDCDDGDGSVHPGATEVCDGQDNNCDGVLDWSGVTVDEEVSAAFGGSGSYWNGSNLLYANVFRAEEDRVLRSISQYLDPSGSVTFYFRVYESTSLSGTWTQVAGSESAVSSTETWYSSADLDVPLTAGLYYAVGLGVSGTMEQFYYEPPYSLDPVEGLRPYGVIKGSSSAPETLSGGLTYSYFLLDQVITLVSQVAGPDDEDADADGQSAWCGDCDDADPAIFGGAPELCNEGDDDCDGIADEGWDGDGDGVAACLDCDDADAAVFPGQVEACNGVDDDCNGIPDDTDTGTLYHADADGDGLGDPATPATLCGPAAGWVVNALDCDDTDPDVRPGAIETCDAVDNDCDDLVDEGFDRDGDGWPSCTDCDDTTGKVNPGVEEVCDGVDNDCDGLTDTTSADTSATYTVGGSTSSERYSSDLFGNVFQVTERTTLQRYSVWANPEGSVTGTFRVYVSEDATGTYSQVASSSVSMSGGAAWYDSGTLDVEVEAGSWVLTGFGTSSYSINTWTTTPDLTAVEGLVPVGSIYDTTFGTSTNVDPSATRLAWQRLVLGGLAAVDRDEDEDGWTPLCGDCDDDEAAVYPRAREECDGQDNDCDDQTDEGWDNDGDGFLPVVFCPAGTDCDDRDASIHPDADELCNDVDDDCDGGVDEAAVDAFAWWIDRDGDGHGDPSDSTEACDAPSGWVSIDDDCRDADAAVHPAAEEVCDGVDNDCDGTSDEGFPDADADGWAACLDCDDAAATINPMARDTCSDGVDQDCDGWDPTCGYRGETWLSSSTHALRTGERSEDQAGTRLAAGDLDADGLDDVVVAALVNDDGGSSSGAVYVVAGPATGSASLSSEVEWVGEESSDQAGMAIAVEDLDSDGFLDLLIGAPYNNAAATDAGVVYLVRGPVTAGADLSTAAAKLKGVRSYDYAGYALAPAGDVDADGVPDLVVGAYGEDSGASSGGSVYLVGGPLTATASLSTALATWRGEDSSDSAGICVAAGGDVNADGFDDLLVGATGDDDAGTDSGASYLLYGPMSGVADLSVADVKIYGESASDTSGRGLAHGDMDADGYDDVLIGATGDDDAGLSSGAIYVLYGPVTSPRRLSGAEVKVIGDDEYQYLGTSFSVGDVDRDNRLDLVVGAYGDDTRGTDGGRAFLFHGPITADRAGDDADAEFIGSAAGTYAGYSVTFAGDLDGDGYGDLAVGAYGLDEGATNAGGVWLLPFADLRGAP